MEAAAAVKSYTQGWRSGQYAADKLLHSQSLQVSWRFQTPSATASACLSMCREKRTGDGWLSMETRRRSKIECHSSLAYSYCSSTATATAEVKVATTEVEAKVEAEADSATNNNIHNEPPAPTLTWQPERDEVGVQELTVYEVNERDRGSPVLLLSSKLAVDWYKRVQNVGGLGDLVPFTNKLFDGSLKKRLGITAGIISVIQYYPKEVGFLYEAIYSFYFGDFGHISVKGPYKTHEDTILTVTGGSGIFAGVYGTVQIRNVEFPIVLFYSFKLQGIPKLPQALRWKTVPPAEGVRPSHNASLPGIALPNFTD